MPTVPITTKAPAAVEFLPLHGASATTPTLRDNIAPPVPSALPNTPGVAILPFANTGGEPEDDYLAEGLSDQLLAVLHRITGLHLPSRASAFQFRGQRPPLVDVAQQLGVTHVLEGTLDKQGNRLHVSATLRAASGAVVWAEMFDRVLDDFDVVQDELAKAVVREMKYRLQGLHRADDDAAAKAEVRVATRGRSNDIEAQFLYLRGRAMQFGGPAESTLRRAADYFEQAIDLDPGYAMAWAALSRAYREQTGQSVLPNYQGVLMAKQAAKRAITIDPLLPDGYIELAAILHLQDRDFAAAETTLRRAIELAPGSAYALLDLGMLLTNLARFAEARAVLERCLQLDPLNCNVYRRYGCCLLWNDQYEAAEAAFRHAMTLNPALPLNHYYNGLALLYQGRLAEALAVMQQEPMAVFSLLGNCLVRWALGERDISDALMQDLIAMHDRSGQLVLAQIAWAHAYRGENDLAFARLHQALESHDWGIVFARAQIMNRGLQRDPRWPAFLRAAGFVAQPRAAEAA